MNSGNVTINGFGNTDRSGTYTYNLPAGAINFTYNGGCFENLKDKDSSSEQTTAKAASGMINRVEIPLSGNGYLKTGQGGKFSYWRSSDTLYAYQSDTSKKDYYVINNGKYSHYQSGSFGNSKFTAQEVTNLDAIGGFKGTLKVQNKPVSNGQMKFLRDNSDGLSFTGTCTTGSDGKYDISLPPGTYTVKLELTSGNETTYKEKLSLSSEKKETKDISLTAIYGQAKDENSNPLSGIIISVAQGNNYYSCKTDSQGNYTIVPFEFSDASFSAKAEKLGSKAVETTLTWNSTTGVSWDPQINTAETSDTVYISNENDLVTLANQEDSLDGKTIELMNDIELTDTFPSIRLTQKRTITFNGNNHTISNLKKPLFLSDEKIIAGTVSNLNLSGNINDYKCDGYDKFGFFASKVYNCTIDNCSVTGSFSCDDESKYSYFGGFVGVALSSTIKNCSVNLETLKHGKNSWMGGIAGMLSSSSVYNCYVRINEINNNSASDLTKNAVGGIAGEPSYSGESHIENCYVAINKSTGAVEPYQISGYESNKKNIGFDNNYAYGGTDVFKDPWDNKQATDISLDVLQAESGTTIGDQKALVDCLNDYVKTNSTGGYRTWTLGDDKYPIFTSVKAASAENVSVEYDGKEHSIELSNVPEGARVTYSVDNNSYSSTKPTITDTGSKMIYYNVTLGDETKTGSATVTVEPKEIGIKWGSTTFEYDGTSHVPSASPTKVVDGDSIDLTVTGDETDAGNYTATVTKITGTKAQNYKLPSNTTTKYTISKTSQAAPEDLSSTAETIKGKGDGHISGVSNAMEYRKENENTYKSIDGNEITNLSPGKYFVRMKETENYNASSDKEVTVESGTKQLHVAVPGNQVGYKVSVSNKDVDWHGSSTLTFALENGYSKTDKFAVKVNDEEVTLHDDKYTLSNIENDMNITVEGVADITAPTGTINVHKNDWKEFINTISFGLFFKNTKDVTITSEDSGSRVKETCYFISNRSLSKEEVENITDWTDYSSSFSITPNNKYVIYAKIMDHAGNTSYISSDGIVIYSDGEAVTKSIDYTKTTNEDKTIELNLNGNTVNEVRNGNTVLTEGTDYSVEDSTATLKGTYLQSLQAGKYEIQISYHPLGEVYKENVIENSDQNDEPDISKVELNVNKTKGSITNISDQSKIYDGQVVVAPSFKSSSTGKQTVEYKSKDSDDATYSTEAPKDVGNYVVRVSVEADENYLASMGTKEFSISPKELTVKVACDDKVYDGNTEAKVSATVETGVNGEALTVTGLTGTFEDGNVGKNKKVAIDSSKAEVNGVKGTDVGNYQLIYPKEDKATISAKEIGIEWSNTTLTYNGKHQKPDAKATGLIGKDSCDITVTGEQINQGSYEATASALSNKNYKLPVNNKTDFVINRKKLTVEDLTAEDREYDETQSVTLKGGRLSGIIENDQVTAVMPTTGTVEDGNAGENKKVSYAASELTGKDKDNYEYAENAWPVLTVTIKKANGKQSETEIISSKEELDKVFDGKGCADVKSTSKNSNDPIIEYKKKDEEDTEYTTEKPTQVGDYTVKVTYPEDKNYKESSATKDFTIEKAKVTVTVKNLSKVYGDKDQELTYEEKGVVEGTPLKDIALSRKEGEDVGTYVIKATQKEGSNPNYAITFVDGTYTINPKEIKVKAENKEKVFAEKDPKLTYTHDALVGKDALKNIAVTRESGEDAGTYKLSVSQEKGSNPNYAITFEEGIFTINPLSIEKAEVTLDNVLRYNGKELNQKVKEVKAGNIIVPQDMYEVAGNSAVESGVHTLTVTGKGNFTGQTTASYVVLPTNQELVKEDKKDRVVLGEGMISIKTDSANTKIHNSQIEIINSLIDNGTITADDLVEVAKGKNIEIKLVVNSADKTISKESKELINKEAQKSNIRVGNYLDIQLFKVIGNQEDPITNTSTNIKISVEVPATLVNTDNQIKRTYYIIRNHEGKIDILEGSYDASTKTFTFETNQFSYYALGYKDEKVEGATILSSNVKGSKKTTKTGDDVSLSMWSTLFLLSGAIILIVLLDRKRKI